MKYALSIMLAVSLLSVACEKIDKSEPSTDTPAYTEDDKTAPIAQPHPPREISAEDIFQNISSAYGNDFLATTKLSEEQLRDFDISPDLYEDFAGGISGIGIYPDLVIILKAQENKEDEAVNALERLREKLINNTIQYPMNTAKVAAAEIRRNKNYIAFILAGKPDERTEISETEKMNFAKSETNKGVQAFNDSFNM